MGHSSETEQLILQVRDLNTQSQLTKVEYEAEITELKSMAGALENQVKTLLQESEISASRLKETRRQHEIQCRKERQESDTQLTKEREINKQLVAELSKLQSDLNYLQDINSRLQSSIKGKNTAIEMKDATTKRKDCELEAKSRAIKEKDAIISAVSEQITKTRKYLATKQRVRDPDK